MYIYDISILYKSQKIMFLLLIFCSIFSKMYLKKQIKIKNTLYYYFSYNKFLCTFTKFNFIK